MNMMAQPEVFCAAAILAQVSDRCHLWMRLEGGLSGTARFLPTLPTLVCSCWTLELGSCRGDGGVVSTFSVGRLSWAPLGNAVELGSYPRLALPGTVP